MLRVLLILCCLRSMNLVGGLMASSFWRLAPQAGMEIAGRTEAVRGRPPEVVAALRMALYDSDEVTRSMIMQSEMIFVAPIEAIRMDEVQWVRKNLPKEAKTSVVSRSALIQGIDGTPFVQMVDGVVGSSFVVFVNSENEKAYSVFSKWTRDLASRIADDMKKNPNLHIPQVSFYLADKDGHCIRIPIPPSEDEGAFFGEDYSLAQTGDDVDTEKEE